MALLKPIEPPTHAVQVHIFVVLYYAKRPVPFRDLYIHDELHALEIFKACCYMEDEGWIRHFMRGPRRFYEITELGEEWVAFSLLIRDGAEYPGDAEMLALNSGHSKALPMAETPQLKEKNASFAEAENITRDSSQESQSCPQSPTRTVLAAGDMLEMQSCVPLSEVQAPPRTERPRSIQHRPTEIAHRSAGSADQGNHERISTPLIQLASVSGHSVSDKTLGENGGSNPNPAGPPVYLTSAEIVDKVSGPTIQDRADAFNKFMADWPTLRRTGK